MEKKRSKKTDKKKILIFSGIFTFLIVLYYAIGAIPYLNSKVFWMDLDVSGIRLSNNGPQYKISQGFLYKGNNPRKLRFELDPLKLSENEKVIRLGLFYQITKEDPLFTGPGLDVESYKKSIGKLASINDKLKKSFGIETDVVPSGFLQKVSDINEKYNEFEKDKTYENAHLLIDLYKEANSLYKKSAESLKNEITEKNRTMVEISSVTSLDTIRSDLEKIIVNSSSLDKEIRKRENCLDLSTLFCSRETLKEETQQAYPKAEQQDIRILGKDDLYFTKDPVNMEIGKPYELETSCFRTEKGNDTHYLYAIKENINGEKRLIPKIANTNYYREMTSEGAEAVDLYYKKHGLSWRPMFVTTPYACNDLEYQPELATVDYYSQNFTKGIMTDFLGQNITIPDKYRPIFMKARELEEMFSKEKYQRYETVRQLAIAYKNIYVAIVNEQNRSNREEWLAKASALKEDLLKRSLIGERKMAQFDELISFFSYILDGYAETTPILEFDNEYKKSYVYEVRSGYSLTYLGFSKSIWRSDDKLGYILDVPRELSPRNVDYDFMVNAFGLDYVRQITQFNRNDIWYEITGKRIE